MLNKKEKEKLQKEYYPKRTAIQVLGCLLQDNELIKDTERPLEEDDFFELMHEYIFKAIYNLTHDGVDDIGAIEVEQYLSRVSEKAHRIVFEVNNGMEVITNIKRFAKRANYVYNYERLRKFTLLRDMIEDDVDVSPILDKSGNLNPDEVREQEQTFDSWTLEEMIEHTLELKALKYRSKFCQHGKTEYTMVGENADEILDMLNKGSAYGLITRGCYSNALTLGAKRKVFEIHSAPSGVGKSRMALEKLALLIAPELWSHEDKCFMPNPNNPLNELSGIYFGTELKLDEEVKPILWAIISGIETSNLKKYDELNKEERDRLDYAIKVAKKTNLHLYSIPDYDTATIERKIKLHKKDEDVYGVAIDYIEITPKMSEEYRNKFHTKYVASHDLYLYISKMFKEQIANKLDVFVTSSTQLNIQSEKREYNVGANMIKGSFSLINKADVVSITLPPNKGEIEIYEEFIRGKKQWVKDKPPNLMQHYIKLRDSFIDKAKVFKYINRGHMETIDLMITDVDYKVLDIGKLKAKPITYEEVEELRKQKETENTKEE